MRMWIHILVFSLGVVAGMMFLLAHPGSCSQKFYEIRLFEIFQFGWTAIASVYIGFVLTQVTSRKTRTLELLAKLLDDLRKFLDDADTAFEDYMGNQTLPNQQSVVRAHTQIRKALNLLRNFKGVFFISPNDLENGLHEIRTEFKAYNFLVTDTPYGTQTPYSHELKREISEKHSQLVASVLRLRMKIAIA